MKIIPLYLNQLGLLKSVLLHERLLEKVTIKYCILSEDQPFLQSDELISVLTFLKVRNIIPIKEVWNLANTIIYLYENGVKDLKINERCIDVRLSTDSPFDSLLPEFHIFNIEDNIIYQNHSRPYFERSLNEEHYNFIDLEKIIQYCKTIVYSLEMLYPKFKKNSLTDVYRDNYSINFPDDTPFAILGGFIEFQNLNYENMKFINPVEVFDDIEKQEHIISDKELHNHIFKENAIEVFERCLKNFDINDKSRSDMKFIFEKMLKGGLIHPTVKQVDFLNWLSETYNLHIEKTNNLNPTKKRERLYSVSYFNTTEVFGVVN